MKEVVAKLRDYKNMKNRLDFQMRRNDEGHPLEVSPHLLPDHGKDKFKRNYQENPVQEEDENEYR